MWMRLLATTRRPACSRRSMILPVILRLVASGLMIEKVRSMAMESGSPLIALAGDCQAGDCSGWAQPLGAAGERKSVGSGKSVDVSVDPGGRRSDQKHKE